MTLGDRIRRRRKELHLSQTELAEKMGYSDRSTIAKIERGTNDLNQSKIQLMAVCLKTTPEYLMGWTNDPYDYDADPDNRFSAIPAPQLEALKKENNNNMRLIWQEWEFHQKWLKWQLSIKKDNVGGEVSQLNQTYLRLAKGAQELGLDDDDVDHILAIYKKNKKKNS